ncbi:MAG: hypothetical protein GW903_08925 [Alphaproteobacteria bacterium]|nr:hypothetical protein [Alphaproteobacteria bacterium]NCQ88931.1 hypothetical protein [Alphaproteobacteria bacterium]NCT07833.1 hypothetical protein [Alphaproteobacteria bacterium]
MDSGRGLAIWYKKQGDPNADPNAKLHVNYWHFPRASFFRKKLDFLPFISKFPDKDYLDIGIWLTNPNLVNDLNIYIPYKLNEDDIFDLGSLFKNDEIAVGVFNEKLKPSISNLHVDLIKEHTEDFFTRVFQFAQINNRFDAKEISIANKGNGTVITICSNALKRGLRGYKKENPLYFRLRLKLPRTVPFLKERHPVDRFFQSGFDALEYIDFRVNQKRSMPDDIEREMYDDGNSPLKLQRVDFLLVTDIAADIVGDSTNFHKNRVLEKELWGEYISCVRVIEKGMVIYHNRKKASDGEKSSNRPFEDYSAFVKMKVRIVGMKTVFIFAIIALVIGLSTEFLASYIRDKTTDDTVLEDVIENNVENSGDNHKNDS